MRGWPSYALSARAHAARTLVSPPAAHPRLAGFAASASVPPCPSLQAVSVQEGLDAPNGGLTFSSQHNAEVSLDAANLWTWEFDG